MDLLFLLLVDTIFKMYLVTICEEATKYPLPRSINLNSGTVMLYAEDSEYIIIWLFNVFTSDD